MKIRSEKLNTENLSVEFQEKWIRLCLFIISKPVCLSPSAWTSSHPFLWLFLSYPYLHLYLWNVSPFFCFFSLDENEEPKEIEIVAVFKTLTERIKYFPEDTISNIVMSDNFLIQLGTFSCLNRDLSTLLPW